MPWTMSFGYMMNRISLGSRGDSKEEEPEKAKGRSGRRFFRPRGKGKGGKRRGKGHYADEQSPTYPDEYYEENPYEDTWESNSQIK